MHHEITSLIKALRDGNNKDRHRIAKELVKIGHPAVPALNEAFKDGNKEFHDCIKRVIDEINSAEVPDRKIVRGQQRAGYVRAENQLIEVLKRGDERERFRAEEELVALGATAVLALIEELKDDFNQRQIRGALVKIGSAAVPALIEAFKDNDAGFAAGL